MRITDVFWQSIFAFSIITIVGVLAQYEWQARDAFDEIRVKVDKVTPDNCPIQHLGDLYLNSDLVESIASLPLVLC